jgi:hypothetical protein
VSLTYEPEMAAADSLVSVAGDVSGIPGGAVVEVQSERSARWSKIVVGRTSPRGRFALTFPAPVEQKVIVLRIAALSEPGIASIAGPWKMRVSPTKQRAVTVASNVVELDPSVVVSEPPPGQPGTLQYAGGDEVQDEDIVAIGHGPKTPDGLLGRVTSVFDKNGTTTTSIVPVHLADVVPQGDIDDANIPTGHMATPFKREVFTCGRKGSATVTSMVSFNASLRFSADWRLLGGPQRASLIATTAGTGSVIVTAQAMVDCRLANTPLVTWTGPPTPFSVGPVPVVLVSRVTVDVGANADATAKFTTQVGGGFAARAGFSWTKKQRPVLIHSFDPHPTPKRPELTGRATVAAYLTPRIAVLFYGVAGPEISLTAGLELSADPSTNPWWKLSAPVDVTASTALPALRLRGLTLRLWRKSFPIAYAPRDPD